MSGKTNSNKQDTLFTVFEQAGEACNSIKEIRVEDMGKLNESLAEMRMIEGFPGGDVEAILALSLPPYYTACPNPFINDEISGMKNENSKLTIQPFTADVSVGKNDPLYFAHYYSTKVPPRAITPYIEHYTEAGDLVFDGFCGTGMVGVAAQLCTDDKGRAAPRQAILADLSPAATFIAAVTNSIGKLAVYLDEVERSVDEIAEEYRDLLTTSHCGWPRGESDVRKRKNTEKPISDVPGNIEYIVWSDVFTCSSCGGELVYWDLVFKGPKVSQPKEFTCLHCGSSQDLKTLNRAWLQYYDRELGRPIKVAKQVPVLINYSMGTRRYEKTPDASDMELIARLDTKPLPSQAPVVEMPEGFNTAQPRASHGFTHVHHFFTRRNLFLMSEMWSRFRLYKDPWLRALSLYVLTGMIQRVCRLNRYMPVHDRHVGPLSGTLYVSQLTAEIPAINYAYDRMKDLRRCEDGPTGESVIVTTQSATDLRNICDESIDYIFTDPPFGGNLNYSELNILIEAWLAVFENQEHEAVINDVQNKGLFEYKDLMHRCFHEFNRILKPGRWITVEFHNSSSSVWNAIQDALQYAGFVVADVRTLDKQKGTTKQLSYSATAKVDLVISAYKPNQGLEERFKLEAGTEEGAWDFTRTHLRQLPVFVEKEGRAEIIAERQNYLLFDRMVAFHVQRGVTVPLSAGDFYAGLAQRFPERDGMYFLPEQAAEYDKKRAKVEGVAQLELFVTDESSAIQWLKQQLEKKPQTFQEIHPSFMKEIAGWEKHEKPLELLDLLNENFLLYDGKEDVPSQIHSYLSSNYKELRNLSKGDPALKAKGKGRYYVADPSKAQDLEKLRERSLLREFEEYKASKAKKLKVFRLEAVRAGFKKAWQENDYQTIIEVAGKIPEKVLQEDPKLLMWYDVAMSRAGGEV